MKTEYTTVEGNFRLTQNFITICPNCGATTLLYHDSDGFSCCHNCNYFNESKSFEIEVKGFAFNDCGVCMNPEVIFPLNEKDYGLVWIGYELDVCCGEKGNWDFGITYNLGGWSSGTPCKYKTREEAILKGIDKLSQYAYKSCTGEIDENNTKAMQESAKDFLTWANSANPSNNFLIPESFETTEQLELKLFQ